MAQSVFITFAPADRVLAEELAGYLRSRGLNTTLGGANGPTSEAAMAILFTDATNGHPGTVGDFQMAVGRKIPIVGLRIAASFLAPEIEKLNPHVDWINSVVGRPQDQFSKLADQIGLRLQGGATAPAVIRTAKKSVPFQGQTGASLKSYTIILNYAGYTPVDVIEEVSHITGMSIEQCQNLVASAPVTISRVTDPEKAEEIAEALTDVGAAITIKDEMTGKARQYSAGMFETTPRPKGCNGAMIYLSLVATCFAAGTAVLLFLT